MRKKIKENWRQIEQLEERVQELKGDPNAGFNGHCSLLGLEAGF